jgi:hypothetical protein
LKKLEKEITNVHDDLSEKVFCIAKTTRSKINRALLILDSKSQQNIAEGSIFSHYFVNNCEFY